MICPKCGHEQPISDTCTQCAADMFESTPIRITENIPAHKGVKLLFLLSLLIFALGAYWVFEGIQIMHTPPPPPQPTPPQNVYSGKIPPRPTSVLILNQFGEHDPRLVRTFETHFSGIVTEIPVDRKDALTKFQKAQPDFIITVGKEGALFLEQQKGKFSQIDQITHLAITPKINEKSLQQKNRIFVNIRPDPEKVFQTSTSIIRKSKKSVAILHDPNVDQEYSTALYGATINAKYSADMVEVQNAEQLKLALEKLPKDIGFLMILETPALTSRPAIAYMKRYIGPRKKPLVAVGKTFGKHGAILEFSSDPKSLGKLAAEIIHQKQKGALRGSRRIWFSQKGIQVALYENNAKVSKQFQARRIAQAFQHGHPDYQFTFSQ